MYNPKAVFSVFQFFYSKARPSVSPMTIPEIVPVISRMASKAGAV